MQQVWKTDYMGDTRTLDVHIRWIRKIVEPDPRKPKYITTVRGVGYRFAIPEPDAEIAEPRSRVDSKKAPKLEEEIA
jgi:DNA-binding winged helix-turn-helix (wHTH) protein